MRTEEYTIKNKTGLHARPASMFVRCASKFNCNIRLRKDNNEIDAKSMISLLTLGAGMGSTITITTDGENENSAMDELLKLLDTFDD